MKYWEIKSFVCPVKETVMDITKDWYIHTLAWGAWYYDKQHLFLEVPLFGIESLTPIMVFLATTVSTVLGVLRCATAGIALYKAWRDRRSPEKH